MLPTGAKKLGFEVGSEAFFDTVCIKVGNAQELVEAAAKAELNIRKLDDSHITVSFDETTRLPDVDALFKVLNKGQQPDFSAESLASEVCAVPASAWPSNLILLWCSCCSVCRHHLLITNGIWLFTFGHDIINSA